MLKIKHFYPFFIDHSFDKEFYFMRQSYYVELD